MAGRGIVLGAAYRHSATGRVYRTERLVINTATNAHDVLYHRAGQWFTRPAVEWSTPGPAGPRFRPVRRGDPTDHDPAKDFK